jgi:hypothetical protein
VAQRSKPPPQRGAVYRSGGAGPRLSLHLLVFEHQRWLNSKGIYGKQLVGEELWFKDCDLDGVDFSQADLSYAYFEGGSAKGARFVETDLCNATFDRCNVAGADFTRAGLYQATLATNHREACFLDAWRENVAYSMEERARNIQLRPTLKKSGFGLHRRPGSKGQQKTGGSPPKNLTPG